MSSDRSMELCQKVTRLLLESREPVYSLRPEVLELARILADAQVMPAAPPEDISHGETRTANGLALSPTMARMCLTDFVRTIEFIRGAYAALVELRERITARPVRVLYVGCGPLATLAVPLVAVFPPEAATFTLLDVHPESLESARSVAHQLGLARSVTAYETMDATSYRVQPDQSPDLIIVETMQACLEAEPQVAIARHLLKQAPEAILIPESVNIDLVLVDPAREFDLGPEPSAARMQRDRVALASVFVLDRASIKSWAGNGNSELLPAATVKIPEVLDARYHPMLFTKIRVYRNHMLEDYDSGLTCPRQPVIAGAFAPGDTIQFRYELGRRPGLRGEVIASGPRPLALRID